MTNLERKIVSAYTGVLMCDMDVLHKYIEEILGRPVWTHELASDSVWEEIKRKVKPDFLALCAHGNEREQTILSYMETAYADAKVSDDLDTMLRIARAIVAFKFDPDKDIPQIDNWRDNPNWQGITLLR